LRIVLSASPAEARASTNPGQHVGLEVSEILLAHRRPVITQVAYQGQGQPAPPQLHQE
jgi:hypothetical protein